MKKFKDLAVDGSFWERFWKFGRPISEHGKRNERHNDAQRPAIASRRLNATSRRWSWVNIKFSFFVFKHTSNLFLVSFVFIHWFCGFWKIQLRNFPVIRTIGTMRNSSLPPPLPLSLPFPFLPSSLSSLEFRNLG